MISVEKPSRDLKFTFSENSWGYERRQRGFQLGMARFGMRFQLKAKGCVYVNLNPVPQVEFEKTSGKESALDIRQIRNYP